MAPMRSPAIAVIAFLCAAGSLHAQADQLLEWLRELSVVNSGEGRPALVEIRQELDEWIALHPGTHLNLPPAPPEPWTAEQAGTEAVALKEAILTLLRNDPSHPFDLGLTVVNVTDSALSLSPVFDSMDRGEIQNHDALTVNQAIEYLPGVSIDHKSPRNQTGISIGGFDSRQVPLYLDGIPAYVPFDGYVDLTRYLTSDIAEVQVARGFSSPLLGPNLLGGVVNLVTREPQHKFEGDAFIGTGSGNLLNSGLHPGARWRRFFVQGAIDWLQSDYFPISGGFRLTPSQPTDHRVNSYQRDEQYRGRVGWTPRGQDSYVLSYSSQKGNTGIPPYSGTAPPCPTGNATVPYPCVTPKYWSWPEWNSDNYYFNSNTAIGETSSIRFRAFREHFPNVMDMYDDATYTTMLKASSGILNYDDHSTGASGEFNTRRLAANALSASFFVSDDSHREQTTTFSAPGVSLTTAPQTDRDLQSSFGFQDIVTLRDGLRATLGFSADHLDGLEAQDLSNNKLSAVPFQIQSVCTAASSTSFSSCTDHVWAYNPVGALSWSTSKSGTIFVTFAEKTRFPTLKDRYSYKAGKAVPNPLLSPEHAQNWTAGYSRAFSLRTVAQVDFFHSDVRNEIENYFFLSPLCSGGGKGGVGSCQQAVNVGRETHEGANFTIRTTPTPRLTLDANYTYLNRHITGATGIFPVGTPRHKTVGTATIRMPLGATGILSARYQSGAVGMSDNSLPLPSAKFATADAGLALPIRAGASLEAGVKNLLDRNYYYWEGFPEAGRTWYLTVRYHF